MGRRGADGGTAGGLMGRRGGGDDATTNVCLFVKLQCVSM